MFNSNIPVYIVRQYTVDEADNQLQLSKASTITS